ncbi:MAG: LSU ribosomal protein L4p (L1e) [uncultured Thiotrichaceae bacterium]|uniref:Large ribosomal subunit protein uL4 n=1 Tax=uncultured Thiotrichaceae bacterium TaxID=298394 RepID=A0A6S6S7T6_9GAMM|nr:MAG: LSU ribosomal protein L4p (L1e) [uncultured Thiotrichaceae bacterium]
MDIQVVNGGSISLEDGVFQKDFNEGLVHQAVVSSMAGSRSGTKAQKNRAAVSGGGIKPWRQKGTGRARAGTIRSPLWRSGGVTFASAPRDFSKKMNKKMHIAAMRSIFSELVRQDALVVVDKVEMSEPKTKSMIALLNEVAGTTNALVITAADDANVILSSRNIPHCDATTVAGINPVNLISHDKVVVTEDAIAKIQEWLA